MTPGLRSQPPIFDTMAKKIPKAKAAPERVSPPAATGIKTRNILLAVGAGLLIFALGMWLVLAPKGGASRSEAELAALQRPHAAVVGSPEAKVTIVEFLDPACETCREFYPLVKGLLKDNPGRIRLAVRLVPFHPNSDIAVRALEAAKRQDKFWPVLDQLLATQPRWVQNHRVDPDALMAQLQSVDADFGRLQADMQSPDVAKGVALDLQDAKTLKVTATPEYFVNGRGLPEFGWDQLRSLVGNELAKAYP
jgi:protein-disulfide isomerase